ncbi:MAG: TRAP transporter small permease subunit [Sphaerochaetaceae bacterium]|jgi:TRAP-type C4-dicarboxylate transport system permease small subunit|nr:TRAP transporter small permease subunit [Spirochaetales bacterium]
MKLEKRPESRLAIWLHENRLVFDRKNMHGLSAISEMLLVLNHWVHKLLLYISEIALAVMVVIVIMAVTLRYVFSTGIGWAEEVPVLLVTLFAFLAISIGVRDHMHISVNIVYNLFPHGGKVRKFFDIFTDVCVLLCGLVLLYYGTIYVQRLSKLTGTLPMTEWPTFIQYLPAPMAGFVITFDSILFLTGVLKKDDLLYSEKEVDYTEILKEQKKEIHSLSNQDGGNTI